MTVPEAIANSDQAGYLRDPDVQLMLRAREGDDEAFSQIVVAYQGRLVGIFFHLIRDQGAAEDLAQEVFLRIYRAKQGYRPTAKFSTWLFHIANNVASNARRTRGRRKEITLQTDDSSSPRLPVISDRSSIIPNRQIVRRELRDIVQAALDTLGERQKMAILLNRFEGMSYEDIGQAMEMNVTAVKSLLARARENLRVHLEPHLKET